MEFFADIGAMIAEIARKVGHGDGFLIVFGSYMTMLLIERTAYLFEARHRWNERDGAANLVNALFNQGLGMILTGGIFIGIYVFVYDHLRIATTPALWWGWVLAFLLNDLAYYIDHRIAHRTGFFWAFHTTHHSSEEMNLMVSNRGTALDLGGVMSPSYFVLALIGLHPAMFLAAKFFGNLWGIFNHTRLIDKMGVLDGVLATPANHRVHHGTEAKYLDRNYGQTLILWDRLFGTFQREEEPPTFGLVTQMNSYRLWDIQTWGMQRLFDNIRSANRWTDRLRYLILPPGWRHDGNHLTSEVLRDQAGMTAASAPRPVPNVQPAPSSRAA